MACEECEKMQEEGMIAYYRWGKANVGLMGCNKHISEIIKILNEFQSKRLV